MKPFNDFEKGVINYLVKNKDGQLLVGNLLDFILKDECLKIDVGTSSIDVHFVLNKEYDIDTQRVDMLQRKLIMTIHLLKYLDENRYITLFDCANFMQSSVIIGQGAQNVTYIPYEFPDKEVAKLILSYYSKQIIVSEELIDLVLHKYIPQEERHFRDTLCATWAGIIASIVIGLVEMGISIWLTGKAFLLNIAF